MPHSQRHYGLDWLRIAAFALLILYHIAMVFSPWAWVIKTNHSYAELIPPLALLTPWRLPLLFAVSGYASARLFARDPGGFARSRAVRLLIPLAFGMAVLVPLEMWVRVMEHGYARGYLPFWAQDYWRWGSFHGVEFPSWEHLWFLAYLAAYTGLAAAALGWRRERCLALLDRGLAWLCSGRRLLWVPIATLGSVKLALLFVVREDQGLLTDWGGHAHYLPIFLFGFAVARSDAVWRALARVRGLAIGVAAASGTVVVAIELRFPGTTIAPHAWTALDRAAVVAMGWSMILLLFHLADRWWNVDHRWRRPLAEAVFPAYLTHHAAIVLIAWYTLPLGLGPWAEFGLLLAGTVATCAATCLLGRYVPWLRPLIGLNPARRSPSPRQAAARATA
jgi:glucans biosynthesis protein C